MLGGFNRKKFLNPNRYCVYLHKRKDNGKIFYVGQGVESRPHVKIRRNQNWNNVVKFSNGFDVQIVENNLTKDKAIELEDFLISEIPDLVNIKSNSSVTKEMSFETFNERFYICPTSPSGLRYKNDVFVKNTRKCKKDEVAGCVSTRGYWIVCVDYKNYQVHRIVFLLSRKQISSNKLIDHLDGNPLNNNVENLREVTCQENRMNLKLDKRNKTGITGIVVKKNRVEASVNIEGIRKFKSFSFSKHGDKSFQLAVDWRIQTLKVLQEKGVGYTNRHIGV